MDDLSTCSYATKPNIVNVDVRDYISNEKYDICLTSPPYLNRLDYVVAHIPELTVLNVFLKFSIPDLKSMMIGTTKINEKNYGEPPSVWGRYCNEVLKKSKHIAHMQVVGIITIHTDNIFHPLRKH